MMQGPTHSDAALLAAAAVGNTHAVATAVAEGASLSAENERGQTALCVAAECGHISVLEWLLAARVDASSAGGGGWTPLMWACWGRADHVVDLLVNEYECDLRCKDKNGLTPLHIACAHSRPEAPVVVGHLVAPGGTFLSQRHMRDTLGAVESGLGNTALHVACAAGAEKVCRILIDCNAPLDARPDSAASSGSD